MQTKSTYKGPSNRHNKGHSKNEGAEIPQKKAVEPRLFNQLQMALSKAKAS